METCHGCSVFILTSLCIATTIVVLIVSTHFSATLPGSKFVFLPDVQFQRLFTNSDHNRAVLSSVSFAASHSNSFNKTSEVKTSMGISSCLNTWLLYIFLSFIVFFSSFYDQYFQSHPNDNPSSSHPLISHQNNGFPPRVEEGGIRYNKSEKTKISGVKSVEEGLARARAAIKEASKSQSYSSFKEESFVPRGSVYVNPSAFHQSHVEMEKRFKVWVYKEGEMPLFHKGPMVDIYSVEGQFIDEMESGKSPFSATNPNEAIAFFLPVSIANIIRYVYRPYTDFSRRRLQNIVEDYVHLVSRRYPFWNRTNGADHFLVSCHDWAPDVSSGHPNLFKNFIRGLCNANASEGFQPNRDVALPEIKIPPGKLGKPFLDRQVENRSVLAFFAGGDHGRVRKILFNHWRDKDNDIQVYGYLPETLSYTEMMGQSKFCLCPSGHEVASPRVVESIYAGCVPVIISDSYVLPFTDVLKWTEFSVHVPPAKIPAIKSILAGISRKEYLKKQERVIQVRRHFEINRPSKPYDLLDMIMHSIWLRRLDILV